MLVLFVFGSYVKDIGSNVFYVGLTDIPHDPYALHTKKSDTQNIYSGIIPEKTLSRKNLIEYFDKIKQSEDPDTIIILSKSNKLSEKAPVVTHSQVYEFADADVLPDNLLIDILAKKSFISLDEEFFDEQENIAEVVSYIPDVFKNARTVNLFITPQAEAQDTYHLSRALHQLTNSVNKNILVVGLTDWSLFDDPHVRDLRYAKTKRVIENSEISRIKDIDITAPEIVKVILYYNHFRKSKDGVFLKNADKSPQESASGAPEYIYFKMQAEGHADNKTITFLAFGDVMLDRYVRVLMDKNGLNYPFEKIAKDPNNFMKGVDFIHANLEGPIKEVYVPTSKSIAFRFKPDITQVLKNAGINIVTIANNHALDQGWGGREDTIKFLKETGIMYFGHPKNEADGNDHVSKINDTKVAFAGFDDTIFRLDFEKTSEYIKDLKNKNDYVVVSVHWGREYIHTPTQRKIDMAHMFVDSGADIVIGHHPHVVQTMEIYKGVPIFYSLGNFVFDQYFSEATQEGLAIGGILKGNKLTIYLFPYRLPESQPQLMIHEEKKAFFEKFIRWGDYSEELKNSIREGKIELKKQRGIMENYTSRMER